MAREIPAVAMLFFQRPELTRRVFAKVAAAKPPVLLLVADGPRADHPEDRMNCELSRQIVEHIDWDCKVLRNYADTNMGCKRRVSTGISWVFEQVEEAIILEDDCVPDATFFPYCAELLTKYRSDERVMHIGGSNLQLGNSSTADSYYFSKYIHVWGWATWRRAWKHYDPEMTQWKASRFNGAKRCFGSRIEREFWSEQYDNVADGKVDTWDSQWQYTCWREGGWGITPDVNLISNIGFGVDATHTRDITGYADLPLKPIQFPLRHPAEMKQNLRSDNIEFNDHYWGRDYWERHTVLGFATRAIRKSMRMAGLLRQPPQNPPGPGMYLPQE